MKHMLIATLSLVSVSLYGSEVHTLSVRKNTEEESKKMVIQLAQDLCTNSSQKLDACKCTVTELDFHDFELLQGYCANHQKSIELALEIHKNKMLWDLVTDMQREVAAMPKQPTPAFGQGFIPNLDRYIMKKRAENKSKESFCADYERALELLSWTRTLMWPEVIELRKQMAQLNDTEGEKYLCGQQDCFTKLAAFLKEEKLNNWEITPIEGEYFYGFSYKRKESVSV